MQARVILILACSAAAALAAAPRPPSAFDEMIDRARAAPAEFAADALIRLASSDKASRERKIELLEEAFRRGAGAQQPLKRRAVERGGSALFLDRAYAQDLDANSLQCRAVRALLPLDPAKARELFRQIPAPQIVKAGCDQPLIYDVSAWYATAAEIAKTGFTSAEVMQDEPFQFTADCLRGLQSPVQVGPAARLLMAAPLKRDQFQSLLASFSAALKDLSGDDPSFAFTTSQAGLLGPDIAALAAHCTKLELASAPLAEAYRSFLVRHLSGTRCAATSEGAGISFGMNVNPDLALALDPVRYFNDRLAADPVKPITGGEVEPAKIEPPAKRAQACESQNCRQIAASYRGLILDDKGLPYGNEKKATPEWQAKVKEYLAALAEWKDESGASAGGYFEQKCRFYNDLINIVPNGPDRITVLRGFLDFLKQNTYQRENRIEWFLPVNGIVARASLDPLALGDLMRELLNSGDPVIALYAALEEMVPRAPGSRLSVM